MRKSLMVAMGVGVAALAWAEGESPWATCECDEPASPPVGTYWDKGNLWFTNRTANGGASFDFSTLDATAFAKKTIRFIDGEIVVDTLKFDPAYSLRFVGREATVLKGVADKSIFDGIAPEASSLYPLPQSLYPLPTVWSNLTFTCDAEVRPVWRNGGAIAIQSGGYAISDCTFESCFCEEFGGAIYSPLLRVDSTITNCVFEGSWVSAFNGYGGAIYVSAIEDGKKLTVVDSQFVRNDAVNGGAICTVRAADDQEIPIALVLSGCRFEDNSADFGGGAIFAEGAVAVAAEDEEEGVGPSEFVRNAAGRTGGAICVSGIENVSVPVAVTVGRGASFVGNVASNKVTWSAGGAVAVLTDGCTIDVSGALFATNLAWTTTAGGAAFGGAVYAAEDCTNRFYKTMFAGNGVAAGDCACYGGAVSAATGRQTLDTCVFDCRAGALSEAIYGGAVDVDSSADVQVRNCSFRYASVEALSAYNVRNVAVTNCVAVGNGLVDPATYPDVFCEACGSVSVAYSAYGSIWADDAERPVDEFNLANRQADEVYAGDTLKLDETAFNPVAGLGLEQPGVADFEGVGYGTKARGSSMGAYETGTEPLVVTLDGSKSYDGNVTSNGCTWTWTLGDTNGAARVWADLVDSADDTRNRLQKVFSITNWAFASADVGYYASTNAASERRIEAGLGSLDERVEWLRTILDFVFTGTISPAPSSDIILIFDPADYAWTGEPITPTNEPAGGVTVVVSNTLNGAILVRGVDYDLDWLNNVNPTDAAKIVVTGMNNYAEAEIVSNFFISAYCTKYFKDVDTANPVPYAVVTNGALSGDAVVAAIDVPTGYCLDWQWPLQSDHRTNGVVNVFGRGGVGKEDILTLWVDYEKDGNVPGGDDVPDKYQARVVFAIVNGWWNGEKNGADKIGWVTLYDGEGKWKTDGTGYLDTSDLCSVPGVGDQPFSGYVQGGDNGKWNQDLAIAIGRNTFPIFLFGYGYDEPPVNPDRPDKPFLLSAAAKNGLTSSLQNALAISDFTVAGADAISGAAEAVVIDSATGEKLASAELAGQKITIYGAETPDGEWKPIASPQTDSTGGWSASRLRSFKFFKVGMAE